MYPLKIYESNSTIYEAPNDNDGLLNCFGIAVPCTHFKILHLFHKPKTSLQYLLVYYHKSEFSMKYAILYLGSCITWFT